MRRHRLAVCSGALLGALAILGSPSGMGAHAAAPGSAGIRHVLLISVDGLHATDLQQYVNTHPGSTLASLTGMGITYPNASTSQPSDSFPGLLAEVTGGSPKTDGVYYDDSYDRTLSAPTDTACAVTGAEVVYDESIDRNPNAIDGGGGIDPAKLPRAPGNGCSPLYPHSFLKVNTIFEVAHAAGLRTAWSDKHPAYDLVDGPSGAGVDDLYNPEIAATYQADGVTCLYADCGTGTSTVTDTAQYDSLKVQAIVNEIDGKDHTGATTVGVPSIFGMNFQAVSVGQKSYRGGYVPDASAVGGFAPTGDTVIGLDSVDRGIGRMVRELSARGLLT